MASGARKWLVGCGIGCGLMILAVGGIGTCGYLGVRNIKDRAERLDAGFEAVTAEYGRPDEFTPPADGVVPAGRLELFLEVRGLLAPSRNELGAVLVELDAGTEGGRGVLNKIRAGMSLLPSMLDFIDERNQVLLDRGMGVGEYTYIYSLAYYAWLDKDPGDGPDFAVTDHGDGDDGTSFRWEGGREDPGDVREQRRDDLRRQLNRLQAAMLANQLEAARDRGGGRGLARAAGGRGGGPGYGARSPDVAGRPARAHRRRAGALPRATGRGLPAGDERGGDGAGGARLTLNIHGFFPPLCFLEGMAPAPGPFLRSGVP